MGKLFNSPDCEIRHEIFDGTQRIYRFDNGYGASLVRNKNSLGCYESRTSNENEWELAVIYFDGNKIDEYRLIYDTPITDDVMGHLEEDEIEEVLKRIKNLLGAK